MTLDVAFHAQRRWPSLSLLTGGLVTLLVLLGALVSLVWTPHGADVFAPLAEPGGTHWLGTDPAGGDLVSVLMSAAFGTLLLAVFGTLVCLFVAVPAGACLAIWRGGTPAPVRAGFVVPSAVVIGLLVSALAAVDNLTVIVAIALPGIIFAGGRTRHALAPLWAKDYVTAARIAGLGLVTAAQRHVLPRLLPRLGALAAELLAFAILIEVSLSFAGLGVLSPGASLGLVLREAQPFGLARPLLVVAPGLLMLVTVLALKLIATGLDGGRDAPR